MSDLVLTSEEIGDLVVKINNDIVAFIKDRRGGLDDYASVFKEFQVHGLMRMSQLEDGPNGPRINFKNAHDLAEAVLASSAERLLSLERFMEG